MIIRLKATIPVQAYGNLIPEFETDVPDTKVPQTIEHLEEKIQALWDKYGEKPLISTSSFERLTDMFGNQIDYDSSKHEYWWEGVRYLSGSEYAKQFETPFDKKTMSQRVAKRDNRLGEDVLEEWELNGKVSRGFGTALHGALELFGKYGKVHAHPVLKNAVESFFALHKEKAEYEVLVVDHKNKRAGRIDRLTVDRVQDFKTNGDISKSLPVYWRQLEFYAGLFEANGYHVKGLDIFAFNGEWKTYSRERPSKEI